MTSFKDEIEEIIINDDLHVLEKRVLIMELIKKRIDGLKTQLQFDDDIYLNNEVNQITKRLLNEIESILLS